MSSIGCATSNVRASSRAIWLSSKAQHSSPSIHAQSMTEEATMKCVQHSRHGTIFRMPNEDAELLVSSGRYVFISKFAARDATVKPRRRPWLIGAALAAVAIAALLWAGTAHAADKPVPFRICLTQQQAAQVYKGKLLKYRLVKDD